MKKGVTPYHKIIENIYVNSCCMTNHIQLYIVKRINYILDGIERKHKSQIVMYIFF